MGSSEKYVSPVRHHVQGLGLEIENLRGQGYDGTANMSSGGSASNKRGLAKGCICTLQWSLPESGNFPQLCFTANQNVIDKLK